ncbi:MAG: beta-propeller domain-containing protein [Phycisphaerae bacterium]|jgi:hypothetical protein
MRRTCVLTLGVVVLGLSGTSCPPISGWFPTGDGETQERIAALRGFGSAEELRAYLAKQAQLRSGYGIGTGGWLGGFFMAMSPMAMGDATSGGAPADGSESADERGSDDFSTTNVQELGVDESDIVKNNGQTIYILRNNTIHIVTAAPPSSLAEVATVTIDGNGDSLYLRNNKLIALSRRGYYFYGYFGGMGMAEGDFAVAEPNGTTTTAALVGGDWNDGAQSTVTVIDVTDPAHPAVEATIKFEGDLTSSRLIDNRLYLVLTTLPRLPDNPIPLMIEAMDLDEWLPDYEATDAAGNVIASGDIAPWQDFYRPENPDGYGIATVVTLDVDAPTAPFHTTALSANAGTIYASTQALYLTDTSYDYRLGVSWTDTAVHKFAFVPEGTAYRGSGLVPGRLLSQYSLGEYQGYLRVATTVNEFGMTGQSRLDNNVYVLGESTTTAGALDMVGKVEGLAPNEQIYAARFIGPRGFLVTFRRVDPLFTLDLSDPTNPRVAGELKVPGYSDHIQLLDENHLLTIGKDTQDAGAFAWIRGVQLSIFDVTDLANPTLLHKEVIGGRGTHSEANSNPKAFNYYPARNALAFPLDVYTDSGHGGPTWGVHSFTGLYVYRVTVENGFEFLGRISSGEGTSPNGCFLGYYGFTRGVFIGDTVYSVTERSVKAADLGDVSTLIGQAALSNPPATIEDCYLYGGTVTIAFGEGVR